MEDETLLWDQLCTYLTPPEAEQIQTAIGRKYIEENAVLYNEYQSFSTILDEYTQHNMNKIPPLKPTLHHEILETRVKTLLSQMDDTGANFEPDTPREKAVVEYVNRASSRPSSSLSSSSSSSSLTRRSACVTPSMTQKLNVLEVDDIVKELQAAFEEEKECLLGAVEELRDQLAEEVEYNKAASFVPTAGDMTGLAQKLDRALETHQFLQRLPDTTAGSPKHTHNKSTHHHSNNTSCTFRGGGQPLQLAGSATSNTQQLKPLTPTSSITTTTKKLSGKMQSLPLGKHDTSSKLHTSGNRTKTPPDTALSKRRSLPGSAASLEGVPHHPCVPQPPSEEEKSERRPPTPAEIVAARFSIFDDLEEGFSHDSTPATVKPDGTGRKSPAPPNNGTSKTSSFRQRFPVAAK